MNTKPARLLFAALVSITAVTHVRADGQECWRAGSSNGEPSPRDAGSAIWTGREMIVWGGHDATAFGTGGRYDPIANTWTALPTNGAPSARYYHAAVWTGTEMIIWGGGRDGSAVFNTGARYNPLSNTWTSVSTTGAPSPRDEMYDAVWTGSEMLILGGWDGANPLSTGGRYNPATDTWTEITTNGAPTARYSHTAVWTGTELIIWGGYGTSSTLDTGARYNPSSNTWTPITTSNAPGPRYVHAAVWTGKEMIVWGGRATAPPSSCVNTGGRYDPASDSWMEVTTDGAPGARADYPLRALWTGREMIIWSGHSSGAVPLITGGLYDPVLNSWRPMTTVNAPSPRLNTGMAWAGEAMIIFGGADFVTYFGGTFLYTPPHASAQSIYCYEASLGTLPEAQGFTRFQTPGFIEPTLSGGALHQYANDAVGYQFWYANTGHFDFSTNCYVLEATLRVISAKDVEPGNFGWQMEAIDSAGRQVSVTIGTNAVAVFGGTSSPPVPFNTTDGFHTYRVEIANSAAALFIDGTHLTSVAIGPLQHPELPNRVYFGDGGGFGASAVELRQFCFTRGPNVSPCSPPRLTLALDGSGGFFIRFNGITGFTYQLLRATSVTGPWTTHSTIIAPTSGLLEFHDTNAPPGQAFYQTVLQ